MLKLHELLAVEKPLENQANACRTELLATFEKKRHHFTKTLKTFTPSGEGQTAVTEEVSDIQTSIRAELAWIEGKMAPALDAAYAIDVANTNAKADVVLDNGDILLKDVPATALLQLEKRAGEVVAFIKAIPTLDPAKGFTLDAQTGTYAARPIRKNRTKKEETFIVVVPATDKFPAQVAPKTEDRVTGTIEELEWSTLITSADKGAMLDRAEEAARAIKRARSKANDLDVDVSSLKIGTKLLHYVFGAQKVGTAS